MESTNTESTQSNKKKIEVKLCPYCGEHVTFKAGNHCTNEKCYNCRDYCLINEHCLHTDVMHNLILRQEVFGDLPVISSDVSKLLRLDANFTR